MIAIAQYATDIGIKNTSEPIAKGTAANIMIGYNSTASRIRIASLFSSVQNAECMHMANARFAD